MQTAFKEWAVVIDALNRGEQTLILRKGGIREKRNGFRLLTDRFWLFPTQFHQQAEAVTESARRRFESRQEELGDSVVVESMAEVTDALELDEWDRIARLKGQHILRERVLRERFEWGQKKGLFALQVRVFRLAQPVAVPPDPSYQGCLSWIELLPSMPQTGLTPVLSDQEYARHSARFLQATG